MPALAVQDMQEGHQRPKLERYSDGEFLVVKTVHHHRGERRLIFGELQACFGASCGDHGRLAQPDGPGRRA